MKNILTTITTPYFEPRLNTWVYRGKTFLSDTNVKLAFFQLFEIFGHGTTSPEISTKWKIFEICEDDSLKCVTSNGMSVDAKFLKTDNKDAEGRRKGLSIKDVASLEKYAEDRQLRNKEVNEIFTTHILPQLKESTASIQEKMQKLSTLQCTEVIALAKEIIAICAQVKQFYPRSYEAISKFLLSVRERYAEVKYLELYMELKKLHDDEKYKADEDDDLMGFGPRILFSGIFYKCFIRTGDERMWEFSSPFEERFAEPKLLS